MDVYSDVARMQHDFEAHEWVGNNPDKLADLLKLRLRMLNEEHNETMNAYLTSDPEEFVDGLIDLIVIAAGTLDLFGVDVEMAWDEVMDANLGKAVGVKPGRPNPLGLPDLVKPSGWKPPSHRKNLGLLPKVMGE